MSTIRVRRLDENWDPVYGNGQGDYITDIDAVSQILQSRLRLWLAEWWENTADGLPMVQKILGKVQKDKTLTDRLIQKRISETLPGIVTGIKSFVSTFENRIYSCTVYVNTIFGTIAISNGGA